MLTFKQFIIESQDLDLQLKKLGLKRTNKFGKIGKEIGGNIYLHKNYENTLPHDELMAAKYHLPQDYDYQVVKYNPKTITFSFIQSKDFDTNEEPSVNGGITVNKDGSTSSFKDSGWIYHHKWLWVADDYKGFDVEKSKQRSLKWSSLDGVDKSRIGQRKHWDDNVVPRLTEDVKITRKTEYDLTVIYPGSPTRYTYHFNSPYAVEDATKRIKNINRFKDYVKNTPFDKE